VRQAASSNIASGPSPISMQRIGCPSRETPHCQAVAAADRASSSSVAASISSTAG
jgi:hypothetical protein